MSTPRPMKKTNADYLRDVLVGLPSLEATAGYVDPRELSKEARRRWNEGREHLAAAREAFAGAFNELGGPLEVRTAAPAKASRPTASTATPVARIKG